MSIANGKMVLLSVLMFAAVPAAMADTVTLSGKGVTIRYEDRAAGLIGAPSLIATGMMSSPASIAAARVDAPSGMAPEAGAAGVSAVGREAAPRSFADAVAQRYSLGVAGERGDGLDSLLLAGLALFAVIARQRLSAMSRVRNSPLFQ